MPPFRGKFLKSGPIERSRPTTEKELGLKVGDEPVGIGKKPDETLELCQGRSPFRSVGPSVGGYISGGTTLRGDYSNQRG